jgi:hypothetical protein
MHAGGSSSRDRASSPVDIFDFGASSPPHPSCQCIEYSLRILDLESHLSLMKHQAQIPMDKASKSCGSMKQISILEDKVSGRMAKIVHLEECNSFLVGIVESVCEMLRCKVPCNLPFFLFTPLLVANTFSLSQALAWTLLVRHVGFLNELWLSRNHQRESKVCGLISGAVVLLCFFKIVLSTLEKLLMVVKDL